ncbi:MAG: retinol dehydrogenase [Acidimicrobiia bacterium]|nr:MAG: retinol dehydrogenase [Acidimicrobiia bacterium]
MTGPTSGIGRVVAVRLAEMGFPVVLVGRSRDRLLRVREEIARAGGDAEHLVVDLSSLTSVRQAADQLPSEIGILVNNAGTAERGVTEDGFELMFAVNFLAPFLLTALLGDRLASGRVVNVASHAHYRAKGIDWDGVRGPTRSLTGFPEYARSKLAMVAWSRELAHRRSDVDVYAVHPGVVATGIWRRMPQPLRWLYTRRLLTPEQGATTVLMCAADPEVEGRSGLYWSNRRPVDPSPLARDDRLAREVWEKASELVGI